MTIRPAGSDNRTRPPTILIADDEPAIVDLLAQFLQDEGYAVERAGDGRAALELMRRVQPDLIIADVMMPRMSGFDLVDALASAETRVPVILMSAAVVSRRDEVAFIAKPFDLGELLDLIETNLGDRSA